MNRYKFQYDFDWNVKDAEAEENGLFFQQTESKKEDTPDRTEGEYKVIKLYKEAYHQLSVI